MWLRAPGPLVPGSLVLWSPGLGPLVPWSPGPLVPVASWLLASWLRWLLGFSASVASWLLASWLLGFSASVAPWLLRTQTTSFPGSLHESKPEFNVPFLLKTLTKITKDRINVRNLFINTFSYHIRRQPLAALSRKRHVLAKPSTAHQEATCSHLIRCFANRGGCASPNPPLIFFWAD